MQIPRFVVVLVVFCLPSLSPCETAQSQSPEAARASAAPAKQPNNFLLEALVDFPDDALAAERPLTAGHIDQMMARLAELGVRRVSWGYYGDGHGGYLIPAGCGDRQDQWKYYDLTYRQLGNPLKVAVEAGHCHGLEVYAYFKPYETGPAVCIPAGAPEARQWGRLAHLGGSLTWLDPFVVHHPELRIQHCAGERAGYATPPSIHTIRLTKCDAAATRITKEHLQIWTSPNNWRYQRADVPFEFSQAVTRCPRDIRSARGQVLTHKGDPVRALTLSGLNLREKYVLVTTDFREGPGDFIHAGTAMLTVLDEQGREIPGVIAHGDTVWLRKMVDFRSGGLMFDYGWGAQRVMLDEPNTSGHAGFVAYTAGRNKYLPGALCETEPKVQEFWLSCLEEMIAAGVDGVDLREENHSTHTDFPDEYGCNPVVIERCKGLEGNLRDNIARVRGEAYTDFLRRCKQRLSACGKRMRYNLQLDWFRADPPASRLAAYPANIRFEWRRWLNEGLMDEAILRFFELPVSAAFEDKVAREMVTACRQRNIPICFNRYVSQAGDKLPAEIQRVAKDGRFSGFIFYETANFLKFDASGGCSIVSPITQQAAKGVRN